MQDGSHALGVHPAGARPEEQTFWSKLAKALVARLRTISIRRRVASLRFEDSLALGERRSLLVVRWEDRRYLLGLTPQSVQLIDTRLPSSSSAGADGEAPRS